MKKILIFIAAIVLSIGAFGQTKTNSRIMLDSLNNKLNNGIIDHFALKDGNLVAIKANGDTLDYHITISGGQELSEVAVMLSDTTHTNGLGILYTQWQVDSIAAAINGYSASRLEFIVDTTAYAPGTGDSILIRTEFINKHLEVYRGADGDSLFKQYRKPVGQTYHNGYSFQKATGTTVFTPHFETNEHVIIEATDSTSWTNLAFTLTFEAEYDTVLTAFASDPLGDTLTWQNALVKSLDSLILTNAKSAWDNMDVLYVFAGHRNDGDEALINWVKPGTNDATEAVATTWTKNVGYTGDGTENYLQTHYHMRTDTVNYGKNDGAVGIYLQSNVVEDLGIFGAYDGADRTSLTSRSTANTAVARINQATGGSMTIASQTDGSGLYILSRTGPTAMALYRNGTSIGTDTDASTTSPNSEMLIMRVPLLAFYTTNSVSIFFIMSGVANATEADKITDIFERYMDKVGGGVI